MKKDIDPDTTEAIRQLRKAEKHVEKAHQLTAAADLARRALGIKADLEGLRAEHEADHEAMR